MDPMDSGQKFSPTQGHEFDAFLPVADSHNLVKKKGARKKLLIGLGLLLAAATVSLLTGMLVWHFHLRRDVRSNRMYIGTMGINDQPFIAQYEDSHTAEFTELASKVNKQLKLIYSKNSVLAKNFKESTVQTFSEGEDANTVIAYYESVFDVHNSMETRLDEAISSLVDTQPEPQRGGRMMLAPSNALNVNRVVTQALDPRMARSTLQKKQSKDLHVSGGGMVHSPGFPDHTYPVDSYLQWRLRADPGHRVRLDFHTLILEDDCSKDFIHIYDSLAAIERNLLTEQCGYPHSSLSFISSSNVMLLTLVTDGDRHFPGFRANYSQTPAASMKCGGKLSADKGSFSSPLFPSNYPPKAKCEWEIETSEDKFLKVQFNSFFLGKKSKECKQDYVDVNGERMCGQRPRDAVITVRSNKMTVKFNSDSSLVDQGFSAEYEAFIPTNPCPGRFQCSNNLCINETLKCDGYDDCGDNSDEDNCTCESTQMKCKNGRCKPKFWMCDGSDDCGDNSDEEHCDQCKAGQFSCRNRRCISETLKCDGKDDCLDGSDESACEKSLVLKNCSEFTFRCKSSECISKTNPECDGETDCEDGSDEEGCECGTRPYISSRIVGGQASREGEWPWQVSLQIRGTGHVCGASVINEQWLVTAAHCVQDNGAKKYSQPDQWEAYLGLNVQGFSNQWTVRRDIERIIAHSEYNPLSYDNDIALMQLYEKVTLNQNIWPICLPSHTHEFPAGQEAWITGWGATREEGLAATVLQKAEVRIINSSVCEGLMTEGLTSRMMCAGVLKGGVDACQGDSGGPLSVSHPSGKVFLAGVVSWGEGCGRRNKPGIYTKVTKYREWIREHTGV